MRRRRHSWRASALHTGDACALVGPARQAWASLFVVGGPRGSHGRGRRLGSDAAFWIRHPSSVRRDTRLRHPTRRPGRGYAARRSAPACASRVDCASSEVTAIPRRGFGGYPGEGRCGDRIWTEFGANQPAGDRPEVAGGRIRSNEIDRVSPDFADLRSFSPASGVLDPIWAILKPLNYIAEIPQCRILSARQECRRQSVTLDHARTCDVTRASNWLQTVPNTRYCHYRQLGHSPIFTPKDHPNMVLT